MKGNAEPYLGHENQPKTIMEEFEMNKQSSFFPTL